MKLVILLVCFAGALIQGATGIGFSMLCMAVFPHIMPFKTAVICVILLTILFSSITVLKTKEHIVLGAFILPCICSFAGGAAGFLVLQAVNEIILKKVLGIILVTFSVFSLCGAVQRIIKPNAASAVVCGTLSGIFGGVCNISGPPLVIYLFSYFKDNKYAYFSTISLTYIVMSGYQLLLHGIAGNIDVLVLKYFALGTPMTLAGYAVGRGLFQKMNTALLTKSVYIVLVLMGAYILLF